MTHGQNTGGFATSDPLALAPELIRSHYKLISWLVNEEDEAIIGPIPSPNGAFKSVGHDIIQHKIVWSTLTLL